LTEKKRKREYISALKLNSYLFFLAYIDNIYGLHLKEQTQIVKYTAHELRRAGSRILSRWFIVSLLNKCEISNSHCRAMTRFGIKRKYKTITIFYQGTEITI
jgi:hypothetical protein